MKICFVCGGNNVNAKWMCQSCGAVPTQNRGFLAFAPEDDKDDPDLDKDFFNQLARIQKTNFWYRSRNRLIIWVLNKFFCQMDNFFEIGCRTGYVLSRVETSHPRVSLYGSDINSASLIHASMLLKNATLFQMNICKIPFQEEFDVIGIFDVLEHIEDDNLALFQMRKAIRRNGGIIITVPHHQFLWSKHDLGHYRRYAAWELKSKVEKAGFKVVIMTSFVSLLFPLMIVSRLTGVSSFNKNDVFSEFKMSNLFSPILETILNFELKLIKKGFYFPFGGSLLLVGIKDS